MTAQSVSGPSTTFSTSISGPNNSLHTTSETISSVPSLSSRDSSPGITTSQRDGRVQNGPSPSASGVEDMRKREAWLKAALARVSGSGFVYADARDPPEDLVLDFARANRGETRRAVKMIVNLERVRAAIQVRLPFSLLWTLSQG